jgi:hypothetical protein
MLRTGKHARFALFLALLLLFVTLLPAWAAERSDQLLYSVDNQGQATITGYVEMPEGVLSIPDAIDGHPVIAIGNEAFYLCSEVTEVILPEGLVSIGANAFTDCATLVGITIPDGVTEIGEQAFMGCSSLEDVGLPTTLTELSANLFSDCTALKSIDIPEGVEVIGQEAFFRCESLCEVTFPTTLKTIEARAFQGCSNLSSVTLPTGIASIGSRALGYGLKSKVDDFVLNSDGSEVIKAYAEANDFTYHMTVEPVTEPEDDLSGKMGTIPPAMEDAEPEDTKEPEILETSGETNSKPDQTVSDKAQETIVEKIQFTDVAEDTWYSKSVQWAVANQITDGTGNGLFSPQKGCTRAEIVAFLWKQAGRPVSGGKNPFTDVNKGDWYYDAVLWAVENGITIGIGNNCFSPNKTCTRAEIVRFLWNQEGKPAVQAYNPFRDVSESDWYYDSVLWAVGVKVTNGTSADTFSPMKTCTRAEAVTFLYNRSNAE